MTVFGPTRVVSFLFALALVFASAFPVPALAEKDSLQFLRAVHLLRRISPGEHWLPVSVPRKVINHDTTNALAMNPDRTFVIRQALRDLAPSLKTRPAARHYAAHGHFLLGEHREAARLMRAYLEEARSGIQDHAFLTLCLYNAKDYQGVREVAAVWRVHAPACDETRLGYVWGSYRAEGRHGDAMAAVLTDPCQTWRSQVLYAESRRALGEEEQAEQDIIKLGDENPAHSRDIQLLWNRLRAQSVPD